MRKSFFLILWFLLEVIGLKASYSQKFKSNYFYLGDVFDQREIRSQSIGNVYGENSNIPTPFLLPNGPRNYLKKALDSDMKSSRDPYFVSLSLSKFLFIENIEKDQMVAGQFDFAGSFFINYSTDSITIFPFKFSTKYRRQVYEKGKLEELIISRTNELLKNLEGWFKQNYANNFKLARHVVVNTADFMPKESDADTLYYHQRKLEVRDFISLKKSPNKFAASIFTSMGYESDMRMSNDTVFLDLRVKVYQIKGMSWILEESKTKFVLDHEQTHFNITQLIAEKFKERLQNEALPANDFDSRLQFLYLDYFRMINKMQSKYDDETAHGINKTEQARWEQYVKDELSKYAIKSTN